MRTPWDGHKEDPLQERDPRYPIEVGAARATDGRPLTRIAVKSVNRIVIVQVSDIVRIEAEDTTSACGPIGPICTRKHCRD